MRHGSAITEAETLVDASPEVTHELPDAQRLGRRLLAFARIAATMHSEAVLPESNEIDADADHSLAALLGERS